MSTPKGPPPGKGKPFLADDDLLAELDAWDATFDALHAPGEEGTLSAEAPMEWPKPDPSTVGEKTALNLIDPSLPPPDEGTTTFDADIDEQMTLDNAMRDEYGSSRGPKTMPDGVETVDVGETDFSEMGAAERPSALGELLGRGGTAPPIDDDEPDYQTSIQQRAHTPQPLDDDDDGVYTSASRPLRAPNSPDFIDDPIAPPPRPVPAPEVRRGPAIIRRVTGGMEIPKVPEIETVEVTPPRGTDEGLAEQTRVADYNYDQQVARREKKTLPPPMPEDDYDDIEIGASAADEEPPIAGSRPDAAAVPEPVRRTTTAHVVRRVDAPTKPPPSIAGALAELDADSAGAVVEMDIDESLSEPHQPPTLPRPETDDFSDLAVPRVPDAEDDFSDVAAAVGAEDSLDMPIEPPPPIVSTNKAPRTTPPPPPRPSRPSQPPKPADDLDDGPTIGIDQPPDDIDRPFTPIPPTDRGLPTLLDPNRASRDSQRPPALTDLYQRVKTPTSVTPLGQMPDPTKTLVDMGVGPTGPAHRVPQRLATPLPVEIADAPDLPEVALDLESLGRNWPEQLEPLPTVELDEAAAAALVIYEREVATLDESEATAAMRIEAGRLCERLADLERARSHYDAALLVDPRATAALRGLRRIARASGDLGEATRHVDTEIAVAGALERRPLGHYRIDLLMASGEQDLARVAVGELLDSAPSDVRGLLAHLELAFLDGRADEFGVVLEQLAHAVTDNELRAAVQSARGVLAAHHNDNAGAVNWFTAAAESDPSALAARLGAIRYAVAQSQGDAAARALVDLARQTESADPITAGAAAIRAQHWSTNAELSAAAATVATSAAASDPLVARLSAEAVANDPEQAPAAFAHWASVAVSPVEKAYAAARAAELDPTRGAELWSTVLGIDPADDYAAAQLRTAHVAAESTHASIEVDLAVATDIERDRARLRAAYGMIAEGQLDAAIEVLQQGRAARPTSLAIAEALGEALAAAGRWTDRAKLFAEIAQNPGDQLDGEVAQLRSALAWEEAVGATSSQASDAPPAEELIASTKAALDAWSGVLERDPSSPTAHAASIVLASRIGDSDAFAEVLARAQGAERSVWAAASLALRRVRLVSAKDPSKADAMLRDLQPTDDPRRTVGLILAAARKQPVDFGDAALALEDRANQLDQKGSATEVAALRLRAAQLALDDNDAPRATRLLQLVEKALPALGVIPDLLAAARRRAGDRPSPTARVTQAGMGSTSSVDAFARVLHDADLASQHGDGPTALALYQQALEMRPGDPLAALPMIRAATELRETAPITALAFGQLRAAEESGDNAAKAIAYELLATIDADLRGDPASAQMALESASQAEPNRLDLLHRLERQYTATDQINELLRLRKAELEALGEHAKDRAAMRLDIAGLATRDDRSEVEVADIYRQVLADDPTSRLALMHLEAIVRRSGTTEELADLEDKIATYFEGDARAQASFWTRSGETLAELGRIDDAVQRFGRAEGVMPGYLPALDGWRQAALKGQLWIDVAEAAQRAAAATSDLDRRGDLYHFAGVTLMDKALSGEQAMVAFRRALDANPKHKDAFLRLRILLEEDANHDDLAMLLAQRLDVEDDPKLKIDMHRALAELHRNFLSDRDTAKQHYRMILEDDPNDLRAHAAVADIAWEQGAWQEAADALMSRARLERQPEVLKTLCFRLGLIYADRLVDVGMALKAFQRALTYQPDDEQTLVRLADLSTQAGEWKLALGACERLVKNETDPDRRAAHLHRVAKIFREGFGDQKRAERALNLALDGAPTNDEALQAVVNFYKEARDLTSIRVHLNRVAGAMRARAGKDPQDGVAYRVIARAMSARASTNTPGSRPIARAAAELAELLGAAGEPEQRLIVEAQAPDLSLLGRPEADEVLFPRGVQLELRQLYQLLGDRIAKHVGVDLRPYGVARGDRLRARDNSIASVAQSVASALGFGDIDVYVSNRQPYAMVAEPTSPVSLVIGSAIAQGGGDSIRFASGGALKLAQASLAIPARLPLEDLGVLTVALLRLFQPEFPGLAVDADAVTAQVQKLKRLIPTSLMNELKPFALAVDSQQFNHRYLARDLRIAGLRAGLVASGSLLAGLRILSGASGAELPSFLADPVAQGLITFALGEDHAAVAR